MKDDHIELNSKLCHGKENFEMLLTICKSYLEKVEIIVIN